MNTFFPFSSRLVETRFLLISFSIAEIEKLREKETGVYSLIQKFQKLPLVGIDSLAERRF